ncbi:MAG: Rab family GTPase [Candidatus Odinarchaeota archaeon]
MSIGNYLRGFELDAEKKFKICLIGDAEVGKTCLLTRYLEDIFLENSRPTSGVDIKEKEEIVSISERSGSRDGRYHSQQFEYWDLGGQELFEQVRGMYLKGADGILLCFSLTEGGSFVDIPGHGGKPVGGFVKELIKALGSEVKEIPVLVVGTKNDLVGDEEEAVNPKHVTIAARKLRKAGMNIISHEKDSQVDSRELNVFAKHHEKFNRMWEVEKWKTGINWIKTSSKTSEGVKEAFEIMKKVLFQASMYQVEEVMKEKRIQLPGLRMVAEPRAKNTQTPGKEVSEGDKTDKKTVKRDLERVW